MPVRNLNVEIEVCWKDTKYYLYLRIVEFVDSILGVNVSKTHLDFFSLLMPTGPPPNHSFIPSLEFYRKKNFHPNSDENHLVGSFSICYKFLFLWQMAKIE